MKIPLLVTSLILLTLTSCCPTKKCINGQIRVIPYFDGKDYQLPSVPIKGYYVVTHTNPGHRFNVVAFGRENVNCNSDVSTLNLDCCTKYTFSLFVAFENPDIPDKSLDSATVKIKGKQACFIFDVDPHHN